MLKFDVSELKTLNECTRKWQLTSRNAMHLRSRNLNRNLTYGTLFHECLASMYMGGDIDKILEQGLELCVDDAEQRMFESMLLGYFDEVYLNDVERFRVLEIEHAVHYPIIATISGAVQVELIGSIDMLALDINTNEVWGFEHKTGAKFRPDLYSALDEQPRAYYLEIKNFVEQARKRGEGKDWTVGGIYINEIRKLKTKFEHKRTAFTYSEQQVRNFVNSLISVGNRIQQHMDGATCNPQPSFMKCQMCEMASVCDKYGFEDVQAWQVLKEFEDDYEYREVDHLEEKRERMINA